MPPDTIHPVFAHEFLGEDSARPLCLWAHGWGQNRKAFLPLAGSLEKSARHILIDLPGFGETAPPAETWSTADYADAAAAFIRAQNTGPVIWIGHSFGCRVGIQLAARHPDLVRGLFLIAAAGLKRQRPLHKKIYMKARVALFKTLKKLIPAGLINEAWLYKTFGNHDPHYRNPGPMRAIFVKTVNEDLAPQAAQIRCPVTLLYGANDSETPPEIGERLKALIPGAELVILDGQDHYTVLGAARHQVAPFLKRFIEQKTGSI